MGTLSYGAAMSLDGYVTDASGDFQWSAPSEPVFAAHVDRMAESSTEWPSPRPRCSDARPTR